MTDPVLLPCRVTLADGTVTAERSRPWRTRARS
jgi:hypothetical protein